MRSLIAAVWLVLGCSGSREPYHPYVPDHTNDPVVAGVITGAAVAVYAVGGGCKIADCPADTICNPGSERCERIECGGPVANDPCPPSSQCSSTSGTCVPF
jgi:hypothetical protein